MDVDPQIQQNLNFKIRGCGVMDPFMIQVLGFSLKIQHYKNRILGGGGMRSRNHTHVDS